MAHQGQDTSDTKSIFKVVLMPRMVRPIPDPRPHRGLRDNCRTIAPDHIGCGLSDKPDDGRYEYDLERRVKDLESLIDHLKLERRITLVLHDCYYC